MWNKLTLETACTIICPLYYDMFNVHSPCPKIDELMETFLELRLSIKGVECNFSLNRTPSNGFQISFGRKSFSLEADFCLDLRSFHFLSCWFYLFMPIKGRWDDWCLISLEIRLGLDEIRRTNCCALVDSPHIVIVMKKNQILENGSDTVWYIATLLFVITLPMIE